MRSFGEKFIIGIPTARDSRALENEGRRLTAENMENTDALDKETSKGCVVGARFCSGLTGLVHSASHLGLQPRLSQFELSAR